MNSGGFENQPHRARGRFSQPFLPELWANALQLMAALVACALVFHGDLHAHEIRPALLDINEREPGLFRCAMESARVGRDVVADPTDVPGLHEAGGATIGACCSRCDSCSISVSKPTERRLPEKRSPLMA